MNVSHILIAAIVCYITIDSGDSTISFQWSSWSRCSSVDDPRCLSRSLICRTPDGIESVCRHGNESVQQELRNCTSCSGSWISKLKGSCSPSCYNTSRWETDACSTNSSCIRLSKMPCTNLTMCEGEWKIKQVSPCNATCGISGKQLEVRECLKNKRPSVECAGSFGLIKETTAIRSCHNEVCNLWSNWWNSSSCSRSCGGGYKNRSRVCLNATNCNAAKYIEVITELCNNHSCASWSVWFTSSVCNKGQQARSRVCLHNGALYNGCEGGANKSLQTEVLPCNLSTTEPTSEHCSQLLYTFTIPLIAGISSAFLFFLIVVVLLIRKCNRSEKKTSLSDHDVSGKRASACLIATSIYTSDAETENRATSSNMLVQQDVINKSCPTLDALERQQSNKKTFYTENSFRESRSVEFLRADSFPNNLGQDKNTLTKASSEEPLKPRPSVRRAERMRLREERREKRLAKRNEDLTWRRTQTLRHTKDSTADKKAYDNIPLRHERAQSVGGASRGGSSYPPIKPLRRSLRNPNRSQTTTANKLHAKPIKPRRHSHATGFTPLLVVQQEPNNSKHKISPLNKLRRSLSEGDVTSANSRLNQHFQANSARKLDLMEKETRPLKGKQPQANTRRSRERSYVNVSFSYGQFPRIQHLSSSSSLLVPQNPSFSSLKSLQSVDELTDNVFPS